jgi:hypothetical protein
MKVIGQLHATSDSPRWALRRLGDFEKSKMSWFCRKSGPDPPTHGLNSPGRGWSVLAGCREKRYQTSNCVRGGCFAFCLASVMRTLLVATSGHCATDRKVREGPACECAKIHMHERNSSLKWTCREHADI